MTIKNKLKCGLVLVALFVVALACAVAVTANKKVFVFADSAIEAVVENGAEKGGKKYIVAYVGEEPDKELIANNISVYKTTNGVRGDKIAVTADNIGNAVFSSEGEAVITVTVDGATADVPVYAYKTETIEPLKPEQIVSWSSAFDFHFETQISGGESTYIATVNIISEKKYGIPSDMIVLRTPLLYDGAEEYNLHSIGHVSQKQMVAFFSGINASDLSALPVGSVLEFNDDFRFYMYKDGTYVAVYKLDGVKKYVWTGSGWTNFVADATDFTLNTDSIELPAGASYPLNYTLLPAGSYMEAKMTSSDESVAVIENGKVRCLKKGNAKITVTVGTKKKEVNVTVIEKDAQGFVISGDRIYYVSQGSGLDLSKISVTPDFGNGVYGDEFTLNSENASYDKTALKVGLNELEIAVDNGVLTGTVTARVQVVEAKEVVPTGFWSANMSGNFFGTIVVHFTGVYDNGVNLYLNYLTEEEKADVLSHIEFLRNGKKAETVNVEYMTSLMTIDVKIDGASVKSYKTGDTLILKEGLKLYKWTGESLNASPKGNGDFVAVGVLGSDIEYVYGKNGSFKQNIQYKSAEKTSDVVRLELGETAESNVYAVPCYATVGEWFFVVGDESVATVDVNGNMTAKKAGRTTVTAYLEGGSAGELSVTYEVIVADSVLSYGINAVRIELSSDEELSGKLLDDSGVKGYVRYVSGKEDDVNLTNAVITGYDKTKKGEQKVTVTFAKDGENYSCELVVAVSGKEPVVPPDADKKKGCGGDIVSACSLTFVAVAFVAVVLLRKKKTDRAK